jgi:hypothetical protein
METFAPGNLVVALNTDTSGRTWGPSDSVPRLSSFLVGSLSRDVVRHVAALDASWDGNQALFPAGLHVMLDSCEIGWDGSHFRKEDTRAGHVPNCCRWKGLAPALLCTILHESAYQFSTRFVPEDFDILDSLKYSIL